MTKNIFSLAKDCKTNCIIANYCSITFIRMVALRDFVHRLKLKLKKRKIIYLYVTSLTKKNCLQFIYDFQCQFGFKMSGALKFAGEQFMLFTS